MMRRHPRLVRLEEVQHRTDDPGVVDQHVDCGASVADLGDHGVDLCGVGYVCHDTHHIAAVGTDLTDSGIDPVAVHIVERDSGSGLGETLRNGPTNPGAGTSDQNHLAGYGGISGILVHAARPVVSVCD